MAHNLLASLGKVHGTAAYDGYGSCPLTVERGKIVLAEFVYGGKLAPSFPAWLIDGTAMGINEFAGYFAVGGAALASGWIAARYGLRPEPFYPGVVFVMAGLLLSALLDSVEQDCRSWVTGPS